jgi:hypothetical protein
VTFALRTTVSKPLLFKAIEELSEKHEMPGNLFFAVNAGMQFMR